MTSQHFALLDPNAFVTSLRSNASSRPLFPTTFLASFSDTVIRKGSITGFLTLSQVEFFILEQQFLTRRCYRYKHVNPPCDSQQGFDIPVDAPAVLDSTVADMDAAPHH